MSPSGRWQRVANPRPVRGTWVRIPPSPPFLLLYDSSMEISGIDNGMAVESAGRRIKDKMISVLGELSDFQKKIIELLPDDLEQKCSQMLVEKKDYQKRYGFSDEYTVDDKRQVAAWLFEMVTGEELGLLGKKETVLGKQLRDVLYDPKKYFGGGVYPARNPDLAMVDEKTGEINGWVECKLGKLDVRSLRQLASNGFEQAFRDEVRSLKRAGSKYLESVGLGEIGSNLSVLSMANEVERWLFIPRIDESEKGNTAIDGEVVEAMGGVSEIKKILSRYKIKHSVFGKKEIYKMASCLVSG